MDQYSYDYFSRKSIRRKVSKLALTNMGSQLKKFCIINYINILNMFSTSKDLQKLFT